ncbi:MAG: hypothetical protein E7298_13750 [Lachnospiraceae bacterium]|nr:hypothetical protein [Lachnospiraceae bacterium]
MRKVDKLHEEIMLDTMMELAKNHEWDDLFDILEKHSPHVFDWVMHTFITKYNKGDFDIDELFTKEQAERFRWLESSARRVEYYNTISDEDMTEDDWADFKASVDSM